MWTAALKELEEKRNKLLQEFFAQKNVPEAAKKMFLEQGGDFSSLSVEEIPILVSLLNAFSRESVQKLKSKVEGIDESKKSFSESTGETKEQTLLRESDSIEHRGSNISTESVLKLTHFYQSIYTSYNKLLKSKTQYPIFFTVFFFLNSE